MTDRTPQEILPEWRRVQTTTANRMLHALELAAPDQEPTWDDVRAIYDRAAEVADEAIKPTTTGAEWRAFKDWLYRERKRSQSRLANGRPPQSSGSGKFHRLSYQDDHGAIRRHIERDKRDN